MCLRASVQARTCTCSRTAFRKSGVRVDLQLTRCMYSQVEMVRGAPEDLESIPGVGGSMGRGDEKERSKEANTTLESLFGLAGLKGGKGSLDKDEHAAGGAGGESAAVRAGANVTDLNGHAPMSSSVEQSARSRAREAWVDGCDGSIRVRQQAIQAIALLAHEEALHEEIFLMDKGVLEAFVRQAHLTNYKDKALGGKRSLVCFL